jgi:hypothetical protein
LLVLALSQTAARMAASVAGTAIGRESHSMIASARSVRYPPAPLARGGRLHLPDVAVDPADAADVAAVMALPSLATVLALSSSSSLIWIHTPFRFLGASPWNSLLVAFSST